MRLSERHKEIIKDVESAGYVWLSHLSPNAIMRFRYKTQHGFKGFMKVEGLTFLTKRVAQSVEAGVSGNGKKRLTFKEQIKFLERQLVEVERELYVAKGVGQKKIKGRYKDDWYTEDSVCS